MKTGSLILFYIFCLVLSLWTGSLTLDVVHMVMNDWVTSVFALVLFDVGCLAWLAAVTFLAVGSFQRTVAGLMIGLDIIGVGFMAVAAIFLGGQTLATIPPLLPSMVLVVISIATFLNFVAMYGFHIADPNTQKRMHEQEIIAKQHEVQLRIQRGALVEFEKNADEEALALAQKMASPMRLSMLNNLNIPAGERPQIPLESSHA